MDKLKVEEMVIEAKNFFNSYRKKIGEAIRESENIIFVSFSDLAAFSHQLSEALLEKPEEVINIMEVALQETGLVKNPRIRFLDLPENCFVKIRNIRAKHLNSFIWVEGIVRQASDVRPQVVSAKFECPSCGTIISVLQLDKKFKEPSRCSCGRKGFFKLVSKQMVDAQRLVVEESPDALLGGEQPRRMNIFLKEDLVDPKMEERTTPGSKIKVLGILSEVPVPLPTGGVTTRFDLAIDANSVIPLEETYEDLRISEEDELQIKELSVDPNIFRKLTESIAPSIYGYEEVKQSLVLQLFGGVKKQKTDGTSSRGDIHILLVGDPGVAKSIGKDEKIIYFNGNEYGYNSIEFIFQKFGRYPKNLKTLSIDMNKHKVEWKSIREIIKHLPEKRLVKVTTEHGKQITATMDHSFITLSNGEIVSIKGSDLTENKTFVPLPLGYHREVVNSINAKEFNTFKTNAKQLPDNIILDENFGFLVGIFLSEGYIKNGKTINISNKNKKIQEKVILAAKKFNLKFNVNKKETSIFSKSLADLLKFYCYTQSELSKIIKNVKGNFSRIKKVPDFAYFAPRQFIKGLISGVFSGDGRFVKDKKNIKGFELITISKELAQGTSDLLFSVGVLNRIISRSYMYKKNKTSYYTVSVPTQMISKFRKNFNFYGRTFIDYFKPIYSYHNCIPCGDLVYDLTKKLGFNKRIGGDRVFAAEMRTVKRRGEIGRIRLIKILKKFQKYSKNFNSEFSVLKKIAYSPIIWSKIVKIEEIEKSKEEVYDLFIPKTNTFVANGIGVHNSVTLKFISRIAPKGRYVVGKSASGAGLTATVVRDEFLKGWSLEAGAMVLANKGTVCIDEIEKMDPQDRSAMHEAMEQQTVTISKANVQASLRAETSVLAAGNPKFGRFDPYQAIAQQIDIPPTLLNRFDVIFMLRDMPDKFKDDAIASHVLTEYQNVNPRPRPIEPELFRKYIAYSKQKIKPHLTDEAVADIRNFYVTLRNSPTQGDSPLKPIPITARQLEALVRLSEASAKTRLCPIVEKEDTTRAINLLKFYLMQAGYDYETKSFDIDKITSGITASKRGKINEVREAIFKLESRLGKLIPIEELEKELEGKVNKMELDDVLTKLTSSSDIFHPKSGYIQRLSS
ncbi:MAG: LAGLIDADG family homing endonuclease [Candidatus Pacearchaeota archaeon]|jgi:replicative DNA helicase Mcm